MQNELKIHSRCSAGMTADEPKQLLGRPKEK